MGLPESRTAQVKLQIKLEQRFAISLGRRLPHTIHGRLNLGEVGAHFDRKPSRQSLQGAAEFIQLRDVLLGQMNNSRTSPGLFY